MDFLQQQDAKKAEELDPGGVETSEGGRVCVVVLCWGVGGCSGCGVGFGFCFGPVYLCILLVAELLVGQQEIMNFESIG